MKPAQGGPKALSLSVYGGRLVCMVHLMDHNLSVYGGRLMCMVHLVDHNLIKPCWMCICRDIFLFEFTEKIAFSHFISAWSL